MKKFGMSSANGMMYHFVAIVFMIAAAVDMNFVYCAIAVCFFILGLTKRKK